LVDHPFCQSPPLSHRNLLAFSGQGQTALYIKSDTRCHIWC
jgi:hypothetical protein